MEGWEKYFMWINQRQKLDTAFSWLIGISWLPVMLDIMFRSRLDIPQAQETAVFGESSLHSHRHTNHHQIIDRCSTDELYTQLIEAVSSCCHRTPLDEQNGQSGHLAWHFQYGVGRPSASL